MSFVRSMLAGCAGLRASCDALFGGAAFFLGGGVSAGGALRFAGWQTRGPGAFFFSSINSRDHAVVAERLESAEALLSTSLVLRALPPWWLSCCLARSQRRQRGSVCERTVESTSFDGALPPSKRRSSLSSGRVTQMNQKRSQFDTCVAAAVSEN